MDTRDQWYKPNLLYNIHWRPPKKPEPPKMVVETVRFNPSVCTCGDHDCEPRYRMEKRVLWTNKEMPSYKQKIEESDELIRRGICMRNQGSVNKDFLGDHAIDDKKDDVKRPKQEGNTRKIDDESENEDHGSGDESNEGLKTDVGRESGSDSICSSNGDGMENDCYRRRIGDGRSIGSKHAIRNTSNDRGGSCEKSDGSSVVGVDTVGQNAHDANGDGDKHDGGNNSEGGNYCGKEINGYGKSESVESLDRTVGNSGYCLKTYDDRTFSDDDNECGVRKRSGYFVEAEGSVCENDVSISVRIDEVCSGYDDGISENVDGGGQDDKDNFEEFEISPAFGILSLYCNSDIHFMVDSFSRQNDHGLTR